MYLKALHEKESALPASSVSGSSVNQSLMPQLPCTRPLCSSHTSGNATIDESGMKITRVASDDQSLTKKKK